MEVFHRVSISLSFYFFLFLYKVDFTRLTSSLPSRLQSGFEKKNLSVNEVTFRKE